MQARAREPALHKAAQHTFSSLSLSYALASVRIQALKDGRVPDFALTGKGGHQWLTMMAHINSIAGFIRTANRTEFWSECGGWGDGLVVRLYG